MIPLKGEQQSQQIRKPSLPAVFFLYHLWLSDINNGKSLSYNRIPLIPIYLFRDYYRDPVAAMASITTNPKALAPCGRLWSFSLLLV
jgi:hypothetical protein